MKRMLLLTMLLLQMAAFSGYSQEVISSFGWDTWVNPTHDQLAALGPCNAFASVAAVEVAYKLYYNRSTMLKGEAVDFSNQLLYSKCSMPYSAPTFTWIGSTLDFIKIYGIYKEPLYPYQNRIGDFGPNTPLNTDLWDQPDKILRNDGGYYSCDAPYGNSVDQSVEERVRIPAYTELTFSSTGSGFYNVKNDNDLKRIILKKGPVIINFHHTTIHDNSTHAYLLIGWTMSGSQTVWHLRDSWPAYMPESMNSYIGRDVYIPGGTHNFDLVTYFLGGSCLGYVVEAIDPATQQTMTASYGSVTQTVNCTDNDHDAYYYWGIGPKPNTCPAGSSSLEDEEAGMPLYRARDDNGYPVPIPVPVYYISVKEQNNKSTFCPGSTYVITAATTGLSPAPTITGYSWTISGNATILSTSGNTATIQTNSSFSSCQVGARLQTSVGWSDYKYTTFNLAPVIDYITIDVHEQYWSTSLCPSRTYTFTANVSGALEYRWDFRGSVTEVSRNGNTLTLRTSSTFTYCQVGAAARNCAGWSSYKNVVYYRSSSCMYSMVADQPTTLFPNPLYPGTALHVRADNSIDLNTAVLSIYNLAGQQVFRSSMHTEGTFELLPDQLKSGLYLIRLNSDTGCYTEKLIVK
jgi:hypothetical protein